MTFFPRRSSLLLALFTVVSASSAVANVPLQAGLGGPRDYGTDCLLPNDDGSSSRIDLTPAFPQGLRFFTETHTSAFVNTNGNITFSGAEPVFTPDAFPVAARPMIAAYWADVDLRPAVDNDCRGFGQGTAAAGNGACQNPATNGTWWKIEPGKMTITWDRVGYYACQLEKVMDFQMVLTAAPQACGVSPGDFDVEFRFNTCEWTTGDASGGVDGFGGTPAQVGFDAGNSVDFVQIPGSLTADINTIACTGSNIGEPGRYVFQIRGGTIQCPEAGDACDTGLQGVCAGGRTNCVGAGLECAAAVTPGTERCNSLDDNCDGEVDEGTGLCGDGESCIRGVCIICGEVGCIDLDEACTGVVCGEGLRCVAGNCVDACAGISCPAGAECRAGRCLDACAGVGCDECSVCDSGACLTKCVDGSCAAGESCLADGRCVASSCATVTCDVGSYCEDGTCLDACAGAVCPDGEFCSGGACVVGEDPAGEGEGEGGPGGEGEGEPGEGEGEREGPRGEGEGDEPAAGCACDASSANDSVMFIGFAAAVSGWRRRRL